MSYRINAGRGDHREEKPAADGFWFPTCKLEESGGTLPYVPRESIEQFAKIMPVIVEIVHDGKRDGYEIDTHKLSLLIDMFAHDRDAHVDNRWRMLLHLTSEALEQLRHDNARLKQELDQAKRGKGGEA